MMTNHASTKPIGYIASDGPTKEHVRQATERFQIVNDGRIARLREGLQYKQQQCFDLLPLLFHANQDSLPGFINSEHVPFGIANYHPSPSAVSSAKAISIGQMKSALPLRKPLLSAIYLMGSSGSIGQSVSSDLDIWVCYDQKLDDRQVRLLQQKADLISSWASEFNLEVHFFLMNAHKFQGGEQQSLTGENCGSTAHVLLLDEFYRTAQLLAGNIPAWWLVPKNEEDRYREAVGGLYQEGLISDITCTDFGGISSLPAGEFIGAGMWQIYKAIDAPYKSVLKLMLLEIYARQFPKIDSLAHEYKVNIYQMKLSLDDLDPYVMLYRRIEAYLTEREEFQRLNLIRRCFYFKVGLKLSKQTRSQSWRRELMDYLVSSWGWTKADIIHLDNHNSWTVDEVIAERRLLVNELTHSYRFLTEFAAEHHGAHLMSQRDLLILSRKLHTAFDRRPGKIDFIQLGLDVDLSREKIHLHERDSKQEKEDSIWAAYNQPIDTDPPPTPLKYSKGLLETLLWSHLNGLISAHLHIPVYPLKKTLNEFELRMTMASMRQLIPTPMPKIDSRSFYHPANLTKVVIFINLGRDPLQYLSSKGLQKISARSNSLDFSALRENLILSLDMVLINNWGEVVVERFAEQDATVKAIKILVNKINKQSRSGLPIIETVCHNQTRPQAISARVKDLFENALEALCTANGPRSTRFVFNMSDHYILFQYVNRVHNFVSLEGEKDLQQYLSSSQAEFAPVVFDQEFEHEQPLLSHLYKQHKENAINLAFEVVKDMATFYIIDEKGSLTVFKQHFFNIATLISPIVRFLKITEHRQRSNTDVQLSPQRQIRCFQIKRNNARIELAAVPIGGLVNKGTFISIAVNVNISELDSLEYQVICNDKEFHSAVLGDQIYKAIASYILGLRASGQRYPSYITDLSFSEAVIESLPFGQDQTLHYLDAKLKLEKRINLAMKNL